MFKFPSPKALAASGQGPSLSWTAVYTEKLACMQVDFDSWSEPNFKVETETQNGNFIEE
jgi:hypothetical protein